MTTPLTREEIDTLAGNAQPVQLTRDELRALPPAERLKAWRAGQTRQIEADVRDAAEQRKTAARDLYLEQHPEHAHIFERKTR